jgi:hypothetical protein
MTAQTTFSLSTLANRFRKFTFKDEVPESMSVVYINNNSRGNRYVSYKSVSAKPEVSDNDNVIKIDRVYQEAAGTPCSWNHLFQGIHHGLIVGPRVLAAVDECLTLLRLDNPPVDDGKKVKHVNRLGGVNWVSKTTFHDWNLTDHIGKILSTAFFADRSDKILYSEKFNYVYRSYSGWSRST